MHAHDSFTPQPVKDAKHCYIHSVMHDWSDENARKILTQLKEALKPGHSKIVINENVVDDQGADWKITSLDHGWKLQTNRDAVAGSGRECVIEG